MISLLVRGPNSKATSLRRDHINQRDADLCFPVTSSSTPSSRLEDLPSNEVSLQPGDQEILSCNVLDLSKGIQEGKWTSTRLVETFTRSSRRSHILTNCITVSNYAAALQRARQLDDQFAKDGKLVGPLHGIPFSFKENNEVKGLTATTGYTSWILHGKSEKNASLVEMVEHLGGIVLCKTNIPQTMMSFECNNPLYGRTLNPYSSAHTCGGSSGGEAALLACDGSSVGFGSDIGGSLRMPAGYCGIYALKPSYGRFPGSGAKTARKGFQAIPVGFAPMCRSAQDLEDVCTLLVDLLNPSPESGLNAFDMQRRFQTEELRPSPWTRLPQGKKLRLGYYYCDGFSKTSPACIRAVDEALAALREKHSTDEIELVEIDPKRLDTLQAMYIFLSAITSDNFDGLLGPLNENGIREPMDPSLLLPVFAARAPKAFKSLLRLVSKHIVKDTAFAHLSTAGGAKSASEYFSNIHARDEFSDKFLENIWSHYQIDGIICPVQASPAIPHGASAKLSSLASSTILYNVLDYSVSICPVTRVDAVGDSIKSDPTTSAQKRWHANEIPGFESCSKLNTFNLYSSEVYSAEKMDGLPVGIQVVCGKYQEEKSIAIMRVIDNALKEKGVHEKYAFGPGQFTKRADNMTQQEMKVKIDQVVSADGKVSDSLHSHEFVKS
ncbi:unnamed protein product [Sympodiomycopsis kandeliae]